MVHRKLSLLPDELDQIKEEELSVDRPFTRFTPCLDLSLTAELHFLIFCLKQQIKQIVEAAQANTVVEMPDIDDRINQYLR